MKKIPSFTIDHIRLLRGIYVSRQDEVNGETVTTFDIRMKEPNREPALGQAEIHTMEHLAATFLRNHPIWADKIIYWGPMGCLTGNYLVMGANFVGSITPPLGIALAILFKKSRFTKAERGSLAGLFAGAVGMITEFAIPFAASDPIKVIPSLMAGSAVGCTLSYLLGLTIQAPHGGLFVMFAMNSPLNFILASVVGALVTAAILVALKKDAVEEEE